MRALATLTAKELSTGPLPVLAFHGSEAVSLPFRFDLTIAASETDVPELEDTLLGQPAVLTLDVPDGGVRSVAGVVARVETRHALDHRARALRVRLVPRLWRLRHRVTSRVFQSLTVPQIVAAVLDEANVPHRSTLVTKYTRRDYCVQYRESDLDFITRLLAEEGIWYFFEHGAEETVVLADSIHVYGPIPGDPKLVIREGQADDARLGHEHDIFRFESRRALAAGAVLHREHDFRRPALDRRGSARDHDAQLLVYDHGESEADASEVSPSSAGLRLEQHRRRTIWAEGRSACRRLVPGLRFDLADHERSERDGSYAIARVTHEGRAAELASEPRYEARFECVPAQLGLRPRRPRRILHQVSESARVVGPEGQETHTDALGRVKVQFHWDLGGRRNEHSSCWLRVVTPWAGDGFGTQFVPRIGMEVLVTFLDGDPDRPIVAGCLYNGANRPPFVLPGSRTKSGVLTRSSPKGATGHELSFEDAAGHEQLTLRSAGDLVASATHDMEQTAGGDLRVVVKGGAHEEVRGDRALKVGGTLRESVGGRSSWTRGDVAESVVGRRQSDVAKSDLLTIGGDQVVHVNGSSDRMVGTPGRRNHHAVTVLGDEVVTATGTVTLRAAERLTIACGGSMIELTPEGIKVTGKRIEIVGGERTEIRGNGPALTLAEGAQLVARHVGLFSPLARLVLDQDAKLEGTLVRLNSPDDPTLSADGAPPAETQPFKLKLSDAEFGMWAGKHYQLLVDGLTLEGTTDAEGLVDQKIPKAATSVSLVVWLGHYPTGPTRTRTIHLKPLAPPNSSRGAAERLSHLGYFSGEPRDTLDDDVRAALRDFQAHVGLLVTGALDAATVAKLDALHGA